MGLANTGSGILHELERLASNAGKSFTPKAWKEASERASLYVEEQPGRFSKLNPFKWAFKAGVWLVETPLNWLVFKPTKAIIGGFASFFESSPRVASVLTGGALAVGGASYINHQTGKLKERQFADAQAMAAASQMAAPQQESYMNSVSYAPVAARIEQDKANKAAPSSHVEMVADRAAATPQITP